MPLDIHQYGGYTGSNAGDCMVICSGKRVLVVDLGLNMGTSPIKKIEGTQTKKALKNILKDSRVDVILTHFHDDHISAGKCWGELKKVSAKVHYYDAVGRRSNDAQAAMKKALGDNATQYALSDSGKLVIDDTDIGGWNMQVYLIIPDYKVQRSQATENDASMGALIELTRVSDNSKYNMLTLGDMTNSVGNEALKAVLERQGYNNGDKKIDCVKLSHHGSESNLLGELDGVIKEHTTVLISGYTMTATGPLVKKLKAWKPKQTLMLFDPAGYDLFKENFYEKSAGLESLISAGVTFPGDFYLQI